MHNKILILGKYGLPVPKTHKSNPNIVQSIQQNPLNLLIIPILLIILVAIVQTIQTDQAPISKFVEGYQRTEEVIFEEDGLKGDASVGCVLGFCETEQDCREEGEQDVGYEWLDAKWA